MTTPEIFTCDVLVTYDESGRQDSIVFNPDEDAFAHVLEYGLSYAFIPAGKPVSFVESMSPAAVKPAPLETAQADTALTRDLVNAAFSAGYSLAVDSAWTAAFTRQGVLVVSHAGLELRRVTWDIGSGRQPAPTYRRGSRHHLAVLEALAFIEARSPGVFAGY